MSCALFGVAKGGSASMEFRNRQEECELTEMNKKGYCNWGTKSYGGGRRCDHPALGHLDARLYCPYYWKKRRNGSSGTAM